MKRINTFLVAILFATTTACSNKSHQISEVPTINLDTLKIAVYQGDSIECYALDTAEAIVFDLNSLSDHHYAEPIKVLFCVKDGQDGKYLSYSYIMPADLGPFSMTNYSMGDVDSAELISHEFTKRNRETGVTTTAGGENMVVRIGGSTLLIFDDKSKAKKLFTTLSIWEESLKKKKNIVHTHII